MSEATEIKPLTEDEKKAQQFIISQVIGALDALETHCKKYCDEVSLQAFGQKSTVVPMVYISKCVQIFKESYIKGADGEEINQTEKP